MSSEESSRKTAANKPANREQENATQAKRRNEHSDGGHWPLPFDDGSKEGEVVATTDPKIDTDSDA